MNHRGASNRLRGRATSARVRAIGTPSFSGLGEFDCARRSPQLRSWAILESTACHHARAAWRSDHRTSWRGWPTTAPEFAASTSRGRRHDEGAAL